MRTSLIAAALAACATVAVGQSAGDRKTIAAAFARADVNKDGRITRDELATLPNVAARFDVLDRNKDGALSLQEFSAGYAA